MTLDEAIKHCEDVAEDRYGCAEDCVEEHRQLAEWLKELRERRAKNEPQSKVIRIEDAVQAIKAYLDLCCLTEAKFHKGFEDYNDEIAREIISVIVEPNSSEIPNNLERSSE